MRASQTSSAATAFSCATSDRFTRDHIRELLGGNLGAARVPGFFSDAQCAALAGCLARIPFDSYNATRVYPPIIRFGPSLNDSRHDGRLQQDYWAQADKSRLLWTDAGFSPDPLALCRKIFSDVWGEPVQAATIDGRAVYAGVLREINGGALVHYDDVNLEFPGGPFDSRITGQLAFNMYISTTASGGETVVWDRHWRSEDEPYRRGYGYDEAVTGNARFLTVAPATGDALLFNPHNLHAVRPTQGGSRIAFAFFLGQTEDDRLVMWS